MVDNDDNTCFNSSECFDIDVDNVRVEKKGKTVVEEQFGTYYDGFDDLRSIPIDIEVDGSFARARNECLSNSTSDMDDPKFRKVNVMIFKSSISLTILSIFITVLITSSSFRGGI